MLYKIETASVNAPVTYVNAEGIEDALFKARKYFEGLDTILAKDIFKRITKIELMASKVID